MMDFIMVPVVLAVCVVGVYKLFELFVCKKERIMLIEKMVDQPSFPKLPVPTTPLLGNFSFSALKVGCLLIGMGLGLLIGYLICVTTIPNYFHEEAWRYRETSSLIYGACVLAFGGIGLVVAFITEVKLNKK